MIGIFITQLALASKMVVLPVLDASNSLHNDASGLVVKVTSELGNGRDIAFNKYGDIITVNDNKVVIVRMGSDYTDPNFVALDVTQKRIILSSEDLLSWPTLWTKLDYGDYSVPYHNVVLRHYPVDSITMCVYNIFFPLEVGKNIKLYPSSSLGTI